MAFTCLIPKMSQAILPPISLAGLVSRPRLPMHPGWGGEPDMGVPALNEGLGKCLAPTLFLPTLSLESSWKMREEIRSYDMRDRRTPNVL